MTPSSFARTGLVSALTLAGMALLPLACGFDLSGLPGDGSGGSSSSSGAGAGEPCTPNQTISCYSGVAGTMGVGVCKAGMKTCDADGFGYGPCVGEVTATEKEDCTTLLDDNCNAVVNEGCPCEPGSSADCYMGPVGTEGVGVCHKGTQICNADGKGFGDCMNQVTPGTEDCATPEDEDCDGAVFNPIDSDCICEPGVTSSCYSGPAGTEGIGACAAGTHMCNLDGLGFDACDKEVIPTAEDCSTAADEDCDGHAFDDVDSGCVCQPGSVLTCDTGLMGVCSDGTQVCNADGKGAGACAQTTQPSFDDCVTPEDDDCDGSIVATCTGATILGGGFGNGAPATDEVGFAVATDAQNNSIVGGVWGGAVFNSGFSVTAGAAFFLKANALGVPQVTKTFTPTGGGAYAVVRGIGTDSTGNIYIGGEFKGTLDLGGGGSCNIGASGGGSTDLFVAKFNNAGVCQWGKKAPDSGFEAVYSVAVEPGGDVYITGEFDGGLNFGGGGSCNIGGVNGGSDVFVAKLSGATGACTWGKKVGDGSDQIGWSIATTPSGDIVVTGEFSGSVNFGSGSLTSAGGIDAFVAKLNGGSGAQLWAKKYGDGMNQYGYGVAVAPSGDVSVTGAFFGNIDLGNGALSNANAASNIFVGRLNGGNGNGIWSKAFGNAQGEAPGSIAVDGAGNVLLTGYFKGTLSFGGGNLVNPDAGNTTFDVFVAKLGSAGGAHLWSRKFGDSAEQRGWAIAADTQGNASFTGGYRGTVDLGAPVGTTTAGGGLDVLGAKLSP